MTTYHARVVRGDVFWLVHVPEIDHYTQARDLGEVEPMARDLIAVFRCQSQKYVFWFGVWSQLPNRLAALGTVPIEDSWDGRPPARCSSLATVTVYAVRPAGRASRKPCPH